MKDFALSLLLNAGVLAVSGVTVANAQPGSCRKGARVVPPRPEISATQSSDAGQDGHAVAGLRTGTIPEKAVGMAGAELVTSIPPLTDADREVAFPEVETHALRDNAWNSFILFDQLESQGGNTVSWDSTGWMGRDLNRLWFRSEGDFGDGRIGEVEAHLLYGQGFARWWEVVVGLRQDLSLGSARSWLAVGIQGLAPFWFDVRGTAYLGPGGQAAARLEVEYELLFTNKLVLQPLVEVNVYGKAPVEYQRNGTGSGHPPGSNAPDGTSVSFVDAGLRLRYEIRREVAPYLGVVWTGVFGEAVGLVRTASKPIRGVHVVAGVRLWH